MIERINKMIKKAIPLSWLGRILALAVAVIIISSALSAIAAAETVGMITENVPDTNIGGATGGADSFVSEIASDIMSDSVPNETSSPIASSVPEASSSLENAETGDGIRGILGILITVIVAVALVMLILVFVPGKGNQSGRGNAEKG